MLTMPFYLKKILFNKFLRGFSQNKSSERPNFESGKKCAGNGNKPISVDFFQKVPKSFSGFKEKYFLL